MVYLICIIMFFVLLTMLHVFSMFMEVHAETQSGSAKNLARIRSLVDSLK